VIRTELKGTALEGTGVALRLLEDILRGYREFLALHYRERAVLAKEDIVRWA